MEQINGIHLPAGEDHLVMMIRDHSPVVAGRGTYQYHKYQELLRWADDRRRTFIDVGAHVGLWSRVACIDFDHVQAFEPVVEHRECFDLNLEGFANWTMHAIALGAEDKQLVELACYTPGSSGDTQVVEGEPQHGEAIPRGACAMVPLDSIAFENVDAIKLDCEGYELMVLQGARETLTRHRPALIIEQKTNHGHAERYGYEPGGACDFVVGLGLGYRVRKALQEDYFLSVDPEYLP